MAIIDFNFPTLSTIGWRVMTHKELPSGKLCMQEKIFQNKEDAFAYYEYVKQMWEKQGRAR